MEIVEKRCPRCYEECQRESVDIGVAVVYGPYQCPNCGWSEDPSYDEPDTNHEPRTDQWGGIYPEDGWPEGISPEDVDEVWL